MKSWLEFINYNTRIYQPLLAFCWFFCPCNARFYQLLSAFLHHLTVRKREIICHTYSFFPIVLLYGVKNWLEIGVNQCHMWATLWPEWLDIDSFYFWYHFVCTITHFRHSKQCISFFCKECFFKQFYNIVKENMIRKLEWASVTRHPVDV